MTNSEHSISLRPVKQADSEILARVCESNIPLYDSIMPDAFKKQIGRSIFYIKNGYEISAKTEKRD